MLASMLLSPYISPSPLLSPGPKVCSLCLCLHCCPANKFFSTIRKIDSQREFAVCLRAFQTGVLYQPKGCSKGRGDMYTYG